MRVTHYVSGPRTRWGFGFTVERDTVVSKLGINHRKVLTVLIGRLCVRAYW